MLRSFGATLFTSRSPIRIVPAVGRSKPASMRSVVVLPQPDGPTTMTNSPSSISRSRLQTASFPSPNLLVTLLSEIEVMGVSHRVGGRAVERSRRGHPLTPPAKVKPPLSQRDEPR